MPNNESPDQKKLSAKRSGRKRRSPEGCTALSSFLKRLVQGGTTVTELARIAQCAPSVVHGWTTGSFPCESIRNLKRMCDHFGVSLALALTGEMDAASRPRVEDFFREERVISGYARIEVVRLIPIQPNSMVLQA